MRNALAICLFFGVWLGVWLAAWLAGVYFLGTETPALFGGFFGCVAGGLGTVIPWHPDTDSASRGREVRRGPLMHRGRLTSGQCGEQANDRHGYTGEANEPQDRRGA